MNVPPELQERHKDLERRGRELKELKSSFKADCDAFLATMPCEVCDRMPKEKLWTSSFLRGENSPWICEYCCEAWYDGGKTIIAEVREYSLSLRAAATEPT